MPSVGSYLRELRQRRGVALDEISRSTRVPQRYLESLEVDDFATLPEAPFTRGFIRAYCQALHEPPDEALAYYEADRGGQLSPRVAQPPAAAPRASQSRSESSSRRENRGRGALLVSFVMLVALGAALFAVTLALQPGGERRTERRTSESPGALSESEAPRPSVAAETPRTQDTAPPAPTPAVSAPTPPAPAAAAPTAVTGAARGSNGRRSTSRAVSPRCSRPSGPSTTPSTRSSRSCSSPPTWAPRSPPTSRTARAKRSCSGR